MREIDKEMISVIIPTRNRAYTLKKVLDSYYVQSRVNEIVFVDDCGSDNTKDIIDAFSMKYPLINTKYIRHGERKGAAAGRITGYANVTNEYVLFGEDDAYLEGDYSDILLKKFLNGGEDVGLVSGRIIHMLDDESTGEALKRFGVGLDNINVFNKYHFGVEVDAKFYGDIELPMTHALFLTTKTILEKFKYDPFYSCGNGYREESDFQINAYVNGYRIIVTNDTHCFHMSRNEVGVGGQRMNRFQQLYWNIYYTKYFYNKYFNKVRLRQHISYGENVAILYFSLSMFNILFLRPFKKLPMYLFKRFMK